MPAVVGRSMKGSAEAKKVTKSVARIVFLGLQAGGQKGIRRSSPNSILFNAEIFAFDGSSGIPFGMEITAAAPPSAPTQRTVDRNVWGRVRSQSSMKEEDCHVLDKRC